MLEWAFVSPTYSTRVVGPQDRAAAGTQKPDTGQDLPTARRWRQTTWSRLCSSSSGFRHPSRPPGCCSKHGALRRDGCIEGSQGTLLERRSRHLPYVTSSNPTAGGAAVGSGIGPTRIATVLDPEGVPNPGGLCPFPTEPVRRERRLPVQDGSDSASPPDGAGAVAGRRRHRPLRDPVNGITDFF